MPTTVLELKLGKCVSGMTTRNAHKALHRIADMCNRCRNHGLRQWERWREDHPAWQPPKNGLPVLPHISADSREPAAPDLTPEERRLVARTADTYLYHRMRDLSPELHTKIISSISRALLKHLATKVPYDHPYGSKLPGVKKDGSECLRAKRVHEAILLNERSRTCYRHPVIPVPNGDARFGYCGQTSGTPAVTDDMSDDHAWIEFPVWSARSEQRQKRLRFLVEVRQLSRGQRRLLQHVADRTLKFQDSAIVLKDKGKRAGHWSLQLVFDAPEMDLRLNPQRTAVLTLGTSGPFTLRFHDEENSQDPFAAWSIGRGAAYSNDMQRLESRRQMMRKSYNHGIGKGRGSRKFYARFKPYSKAGIRAQDRFVKTAVAEVLRGLQRHDCGTLVFRTPAQGLLRSRKTWFGKGGLSITWDRFTAQLSHVCRKHVIEYSEKDISRYDWEQLLNVNEKS